MRVLVGCEFSDAVSCDVLPSETHGPHYQGDIRNIIRNGWDLAIFHPPCTYLTNSGVRWLTEQPERWKDMIDGAVFFRQLLNAPIPRVAVENPIMHSYAQKIVGTKQAQVVQPWMFGHPERKGTGLWLRGLPLLEPTDDVYGEMIARPEAEQHRMHRLSPSADRARLRSVTYAGIAAAMAAQWGGTDLVSLSEGCAA